MLKRTGAGLGIVLATAAVLLVGGVTDRSLADVVNGGAGAGAIDDPVIVVGAVWYATSYTPPAFFWGGSGPVFNNEGPFTFTATSNVQLFVTDDFLKGDQFGIYDFGTSIGLTSSVPNASGDELGPEAAYADPTYSHGVFDLGPGNHSITIQLENNPYSGGRGYLMVIPEPGTLSLLGLAGLALIRRGRKIA
jgi:hypothetical protein